MLDELQTAVATVTERIGPATVTIGRDRRGTGVVIADGRILTNAHNLRDRTTQVAFADGRAAQAEVLGADPEGDLAVAGGRHHRQTAVAEWSAAPRRRRPGRVRRRPRPSGSAGHVRRRQRRRPGVPRPTRPPDHRQRGAHRAARPRVVRRTARRRRGSSRSASTPIASATGSTSRSPPTPGSATGSTGSPPATRRPAADSASPWRRRSSPVACVAPSGSPSATACSCAVSTTARPAAAGGVTTGDLIVSANGVDVRDADDLWAVLDALSGDEADSVDLGIVRGAEELTIRVTFDDGAGSGAMTRTAGHDLGRAARRTGVAGAPRRAGRLPQQPLPPGGELPRPSR